MHPTVLRALAIALAGVTLVPAACDNSDASEGRATSTPTVATTGAPGTSTPEASGTSDRPLALSTYCWGGICADAIGIITPPEQVATSAGALLDLGGDITGVDLTESVWAIYAADAEPVGTGEGWIAFRPEGDSIEIPTGAEAAIPDDLEAGDYLLTLTVRQEGQDAYYGLWISVE